MSDKENKYNFILNIYFSNFLINFAQSQAEHWSNDFDQNVAYI